MGETTGKKKWVKDIAIIFLTVMLILTFFSRTIMNHSLPEVSGQYARYGTVATSVRGSGTVQTNMAYGVQLEQTRQVKQVLVRVGDRVEAGDVLVLLEDDEGTELSAARTELSELEYSYREKLLTLDSGNDGEDLETLHLKEDLDIAYAELDSYEHDKAAIDSAKSRVRTLEAEVKVLENELDEQSEAVSEAQERVDSISGGKNSVSSAEKSYRNAERELEYAREDLEIMKSDLVKREELKKEVEAAEKELEAAEEELEDAQEILSEKESGFRQFTNVSDRAIAEARQEMEKAEDEAGEYTGRYSRLEKKYNTYVEAEADYNDAKADYDELAESGTASPEQLEAAKQKRDEAREILRNTERVTYSELEDARELAEEYDIVAFNLEVQYNALIRQQREFGNEPEYLDAKDAYDEAKAEYDKVKVRADAAKDKYDAAVEKRDLIPNVTQSSINEAERDIRRSESELEYLRLDYIEAVEDFTGEPYDENFSVAQTVSAGLDSAKDTLREAKSVYEAKEKELEDKKDELEDAEEEYNELLEDSPDSYEQLKERVTTLERQLKTRLAAKASEDREQNIENGRQQIELEKLSAQIEKKREQVSKLEEKSIGAEVTARYAGTISSVSVIAGDTANAGEDIVSLDVTGKGYTLSLSVTNDQARFVKIGDTAKLINYWGGNVTVTLADIKTDRANPTGGKILEFDVDGDVTDGQTLNISVGERQNSYEFVVPNSAVREDSNGTFIYIAEVKSTPIGNRFTARRLGVTVVTKDSVNSALDIGEGYNNEFVIVNASTPITDGMQVRLVEN